MTRQHVASPSSFAWCVAAVLLLPAALNCVFAVPIASIALCGMAFALRLFAAVFAPHKQGEQRHVYQHGTIRFTRTVHHLRSIRQSHQSHRHISAPVSLLWI
jgi:hypothetical protein